MVIFVRYFVYFSKIVLGEEYDPKTGKYIAHGAKRECEEKARVISKKIAYTG